jgi:hypothetical protein
LFSLSGFVGGLRCRALRPHFAVVMLMSFLFLCLMTSIAAAETTAGGGGELQLPSWVQAILGVGAIGGSALAVQLRAKLGTALKLFQDVKDAINSIMLLIGSIRSDIKDPVKMAEFNATCMAIAKVLNDTGNPSLQKKAQMFVSFVRRVDPTLPDVPAAAAPPAAAVPAGAPAA